LAPRRFEEKFTQYGNSLRGQLAGQIHQYQDKLTTYGRPSQSRGNMSCQIVRSCAKWSNGSPLEHSIADAYCAIIRNSEHFIYIENQFFITSTGDSQHPVKNKIGAAIVERILRAARAGQKYKIVVVIPSVPCFAGDLRDEETLGTRAIMEFQYNSINRGGHSIMELIAKEGFNPMEYIRFYNLRNYDRINNGGMMAAAEQQSGVNYENAQRQYDVNTAGPGGYAPSTTRSAFDTSASFQQYQQAAHQVQGSHSSSNRWDSVSECYMLGGEDIRKVPWDGHPDAEIDAFVSEELYVHSKVC
jgi:phospholipase D1/2